MLFSHVEGFGYFHSYVSLEYFSLFTSSDSSHSIKEELLSQVEALDTLLFEAALFRLSISSQREEWSSNARGNSYFKLMEQYLKCDFVL